MPCSFSPDLKPIFPQGKQAKSDSIRGAGAGHRAAGHERLESVGASLAKRQCRASAGDHRPRDARPRHSLAEIRCHRLPDKTAGSAPFRATPGRAAGSRFAASGNGASCSPNPGRHPDRRGTVLAGNLRIVTPVEEAPAGTRFFSPSLAQALKERRNVSADDHEVPMK